MTKPQTITLAQFKEALEETTKGYAVWLDQVNSLQKRNKASSPAPDAKDPKEGEKMQRRFQRSARIAFSSASPHATANVERLCAIIEKAGGGMRKQRTTGTNTLSRQDARTLFNYRFARKLEENVHAAADAPPPSASTIDQHLRRFEALKAS